MLDKQVNIEIETKNSVFNQFFSWYCFLKELKLAICYLLLNEYSGKNDQLATEYATISNRNEMDTLWKIAVLVQL